MDLETFNAAGRAEVLGLLAACAPIPRWCAALADARPYAGTAALLERAARLAEAWTDAEVDAALARHPRIGERIRTSGAEAALSRREQAGAGLEGGQAG
ncbi:hypothetical protein NCCP1664_10980 [Zafaria cholistanensis]|uniref:Oxo-4-hydroxy-4-carboxy-5-ureidoimidazoline decarboxylase domain-containing protein n=1 Tax=Zafaria cholistanensis TaxID=1682741 RepID=A0A5A7NS86_9MICC|nr:2-oxo-4-hydroxy-4-carboxy-5-ureidoimidazoline decarboxylase [Zafaria cholistanensis]GER22601.1 hypothetical protein NCCP1664_10980 [Zafaria cholistanensis]